MTKFDDPLANFPRALACSVGLLLSLGARPIKYAVETSRSNYGSSLRGAKRRGNPESSRATLDCRASLAMTKRCKLKHGTRIGLDPKHRDFATRSQILYRARLYGRIGSGTQNEFQPPPRLLKSVLEPIWLPTSFVQNIICQLNAAPCDPRQPLRVSFQPHFHPRWCIAGLEYHRSGR